MTKATCADFKPKPQAPWLCFWWELEETLISFSPHKTGIEGFCSRPDWEERVCETRGLRFAVKVGQEEDGRQDAVNLGEG